MADSNPRGGEIELLIKTVGPGTATLEVLPEGTPDSRTARWQVSWTPPQPGGRRGSTVWAQGAGLPVTGELPARGGVRHVYLPALRDAERELASAGGTGCG